jgi:hypothetical protein
VAKSQYDLCLEVLRRIRDEDVLDELVIIGSWCIVLYAEYFRERVVLPAIRTRDIEFLVPAKPPLRRRINLCELLRDLGFVLDFKGEQGYTVLAHPDLILEFILSASGREPQKPLYIKELGITPQPLRLIDLLTQNSIQAAFGDVSVTIPHPANFALQKLLIARRRTRQEKAEKDRIQAVALLHALQEIGEMGSAAELCRTMSKARQRVIRRELTTLDERDLLTSLLGGL